jgi:predicted dienelactone hydrolase
MTILATALTLMLGLATAAAAGSVGFQRVTVPDSDDTSRAVGIWYPSDASPSPQPLGAYRQTVAVDGPLVGRQRPLVVILHGNQGALENHYHTALALAEAGFVVASIFHGPDIGFAERPRHVSRVLDYLLAAWPHHDRLDRTRIGIYGFSVGGFTALVTIGGTPDLGRIPSYCAEHQDRVCSVLKDRNVSVPLSAWVHDPRIKAAVIAAPTLGFTFGRDALASIKAPVQLWRAGNDEVTPHPRHAQAIFNALPTRPDYVVVPNAGHFAFVACSATMAERAPAVCRDAPDFDRDAFHRTFNAAVVSFFETRLPAP